MFKRIRPVIIVVENSKNSKINNEIQYQLGCIIESINNKYFSASKKRNLIVDILQIPSKSDDVNPNFVKYNKLSYNEEENTDNTRETVDLNPLFDYLLKMEWLANKFKYAQPIVLFVMDGESEYSYDESLFNQFKKSYIFNCALRPVTYQGKPKSSNIEVLKFLTNQNSYAWEFSYLTPYSALSLAFQIMENESGAESDVIDNHYPMDCKIINGEICWIKTRSLQRIFKWLRKEIRYWLFDRLT